MENFGQEMVYSIARGSKIIFFKLIPCSPSHGTQPTINSLIAKIKVRSFLYCPAKPKRRNSSKAN